jgi:drug/metabolite transporter (DMT)-like permease
MTEGKRKNVLALSGLLLLCLLWAVDSVRPDLFPASARPTLPPFERQGLQFGLFALGTAAIALARGAHWPPRQLLLKCTLVGLGLFVVPSLLVHLSEGRVSALTRVALFSLTPLFAVVFEPYLGRSEQVRAGSMVTALAAVVGTLLVFPVDVPGSVAAGGAFCAVIAATACAAAANCLGVLVACQASKRSFAAMIAIAGGVSAAGFASLSVLTEHAVWNWTLLQGEFAWTAVLGWPALLLLFWLMRRISAVAMTTRFLIAPLFTNLIGLLLLRPNVTLRSGLGLGLVAFGAGWLLLKGVDRSEFSSVTLNLS